MNSDEREKLIVSLKEAANRAGKNRFFWEAMTDQMLRGEIHGIDLSTHYRNPKCVDDIAIDIQRHLNPDQKWVELPIEVKQVYFEIIKIVKDGLDF